MIYSAIISFIYSKTFVKNKEKQAKNANIWILWKVQELKQKTKNKKTIKKLHQRMFKSQKNTNHKRYATSNEFPSL